MLTVEIRVNGSLVTAMSATNVSDWPRDDAEYEYQACSFPITNKGAVRTRHGFVKHKLGDGIEKLVERLFAAACAAEPQDAGQEKP